jgi:hypothetical protein
MNSFFDVFQRFLGTPPTPAKVKPPLTLNWFTGTCEIGFWE